MITPRALALSVIGIVISIHGVGGKELEDGRAAKGKARVTNRAAFRP